MASVNIAPSQTRLGSVLSDCLLGGVPGKPASLARVGRLSAVVVAAWGGRARLVLSLETVTSLADSAWARPGPAGVPTALLALRCGGRRRLVPPALVACDSERLALSPGARLYVRFFFSSQRTRRVDRRWDILGLCSSANRRAYFVSVILFSVRGCCCSSFFFSCSKSGLALIPGKRRLLESGRFVMECPKCSF